MIIYVLRKKYHCNLNKQVHLNKGRHSRVEIFLLIPKLQTYFYIVYSCVSDIRRNQVLFQNENL